MQENQTFANEWNALQQKRLELTQEMAQLQIRLNNFGQDPEIIELVLQQNRFREDIEALEKESYDYGDIIKERKPMIDNCHVVIAGRKPESELKRVMGNYLEAVSATKLRESGKLKKRKGQITPAVLQLERDITQALTMTPKKVLEFLEAQNKFATRLCAYNKEQVKKLQAGIAKIDQHIWESKQCLRQGIGQTQQNKVRHEQDILQWLKNPEHFAWVKANNPDCQYVPKNERPRELMAEEQAPMRPWLGRKKEEQGDDTVVQDITVDMKPWEFFVAKKITGPWQKLSTETETFCLQIKPYLDNTLRGLDWDLLYKKLIEPITKGTHPRQLDIKPLKGRRLRKWWRMGISADYRIMFLIKEQERCIAFIPFAKQYQPY